MTIASSGNVGIGTASPGTLLNVKGSDPILTISDSRNQTWSVGDELAAINFSSDDTSSAHVAGDVRARISVIEEDTFGASQGLAFYTTRITLGVPSLQMMIDNNGDLLLGRGGLYAPLGGNAGGTLTIDGVGGGGSGTLQLTTTSSSNTATQSLGNIEWHNPGATGTNTRSGYINMTLSGTSGSANIGSYMAFGTESDGTNGSGTERMRIDSNGNVGIGTNNPQESLDINGLMRMKTNSGTPPTCDATHAGAVGLTSTYKLCVCNGVSWNLPDGVTTCPGAW